jgi:hypothetical protein
MTPKEKARELVENYAETIKPIEFGVILERDWKSAKQCALIAVDEILKEHYPQDIKRCDYFMEVKQEIEKL